MFGHFPNVFIICRGANVESRFVFHLSTPVFLAQESVVQQLAFAIIARETITFVRRFNCQEG